MSVAMRCRPWPGGRLLTATVAALLWLLPDLYLIILSVASGSVFCCSSRSLLSTASADLHVLDAAASCDLMDVMSGDPDSAADTADNVARARSGRWTLVRLATISPARSTNDYDGGHNDTTKAVAGSDGSPWRSRRRKRRARGLHRAAWHIVRAQVVAVGGAASLASCSFVC
eukprot:CAMPEP_0185693226 /NCGR_PEP_ID=MMETSP1164-20130828/3078_1 /TAXON_ID=1104430 /ORGANISM="Chrysoreinhardia sp, Strain CCMP2950" /LENGTH=171 /DNA_ID=CAMNT_0028359999 /DNA_START=2420 /DNA_END=2935 /DNA_ORIENTATION=-